MEFNASFASSKTPPGRKEFFWWIGSGIFNISLTRFEMQETLSVSHLPTPPPPLFAPACSVSTGVEPLYRRGVLGRASKAFITGFAVLYYTGKHRATHALPLTSLWSSAIHEKRGALARKYFPALILYQEKVSDWVTKKRKKIVLKNVNGIFERSFSMPVCW